MKGPWTITALVLTVAAVIGTAIGYVDSRPTWDDTGITVGSVFLAAVLLSAVRPRCAWGTGLLVGVPVFVFNVTATRTFASAVAIAVGLAGAGIGYLAGKALASGEASADVTGW